MPVLEVCLDCDFSLAVTNASYLGLEENVMYISVFVNSNDAPMENIILKVQQLQLSLSSATPTLFKFTLQELLFRSGDSVAHVPVSALFTCPSTPL